MPLSIAFSSDSSTFGACRAAVTNRNGNARATPFSSRSRMSDGATPAASINRRFRSTAMPPSLPSRSNRSKFSRLSFPADKATSQVSGELERVLDELLPNGRLLGILRLGVAQEQHVAKFDHRLAVVLRQLVGVELRERPRQPALRPAESGCFFSFQ